VDWEYVESMFSMAAVPYISKCRHLEINEVVIVLLNEILKVFLSSVVELMTNEQSDPNSGVDAPQAEKVQQISRRNSLTLKKMFSQKKVQDEDMLKSDESFIGLGVGNNIPKYLRYTGVVTNRGLDWKDCVEMLLLVLASKKTSEKASEKKPVSQIAVFTASLITVTGIRILLCMAEAEICHQRAYCRVCLQYPRMCSTGQPKVDCSQNTL
jgi:hypothetical protein